jgi:hypothetical protein
MKYTEKTCTNVTRTFKVKVELRDIIDMLNKHFIKKHEQKIPPGAQCQYFPMIMTGMVKIT